MKSHELLLPLLILSSTLQSQSTQSAKPFSSEGSTAYVRRRDGAKITDNKSFEFANVIPNGHGEYIRLLLLKSVHNEHLDGLEETNGRLTVQAWTLAKDGSRKSRWTLSSVGNEGAASEHDRFFRIWQWGCCDWPQIVWYFSLLSGKKLYVSNSQLLSTSAPEGGPRNARYVAFGYYGHGKSPLLQYGTDEEVTQRFTLLSPRTYYDAPEVWIRNGGEPERQLIMEPSAGFTILLRYRDGVEINIPVQNGSIQVGKASLPEGYSLRVEDGGVW